MTTAPQLKNASGDTHWLVKNEQGETFGPVTFETLKLWARDGRLAPTNTLSENATTWSALTQYPELEMDWVAEISPGMFYGPIHKLALQALQQEGSLPADAVAFQRPPAVRSARKTQPISAIYPVAPPHPKNDSDAVRALERQLDLERQRSHDSLKQLDHLTPQLDQMNKQFDQMNQQLIRIQTQLSEKEQELHRTEQRIVSTEKLESMVQDCLTRLVNQQQELQAVVGLAQPRVDVAPSPSPAESSRLICHAIAEAQTHIVQQVEQQVGAAVTHVQEQMRNTVAVAYDQATQGRASELEHLRLQVAAALTATQTHITSELNQSFIAELAKTQERLRCALMATQRDVTSHATQTVTEVAASVTAQLKQQGQELERLGVLINASRAPTEEAVARAVASLLATEHAELFSQFVNELAASRDQLFDRTNTALTQGREQMMRATGDSQRMAIEYIVREITTTLTQALQAGRENLMQGMRGGWAVVQQQTTAVDARLVELKASQERLTEELKVAIQKRQESSKPVVERTYVEAEAVEIIPPERPRKKVQPEPEIMDPPPPPPKEKTEPKNATGTGLSMADIEQQARRELERLGSQGMNIFKRKK